MAAVVNRSVLAPGASSPDKRVNFDLTTKSRGGLVPYMPVNRDGCFESDRVLKSGTIQKRKHKTKSWKSAYLVLRPTTLSIYKSANEEKLRHKIHLSDLTAATVLKERRFGLFTPSKNYHFQCVSPRDASDWVELVRNIARIEKEEEDFMMARRQSDLASTSGDAPGEPGQPLLSDPEQLGPCSSPEPAPAQPVRTASVSAQPAPAHDASAMSGNELGYSDFSDGELQRTAQGRGASTESFANHPYGPSHLSSQRRDEAGSGSGAAAASRPNLVQRNNSQLSGHYNGEPDPDRIVWQGWLWLLRSKGGMRAWKKAWAVLRPRNLILYKNESEYAAVFLVYLSSIIDVVDIDPISRHKANCFQAITDDRSYRFCARDEESLVRCLGAFKSLLTKRKELEARAAAAATAAMTIAATSAGTGMAPAGLAGAVATAPPPGLDDAAAPSSVRAEAAPGPASASGAVMVA